LGISLLIYTSCGIHWPNIQKQIRGVERVKINQSVAKRMHWISNSAKVLARKAAPGTLLVLLGAGAFYLIASNGFTPRKVVSSKAPMDVPPGHVTKDLPGAPVGEGDRSDVTSAPVGSEGIKTHDREITENSSAMQTPAPILTPPPIPAAGSKTFAMDSEFLQKQPPAVERKTVERQLSGPERKSLERKREEAERKRARLEELYQKHLISSEVYKRGEEKYKSEIEKYRSAINGGKVPKSQIPAV
jgi:hypothetical protein